MAAAELRDAVRHPVFDGFVQFRNLKKNWMDMVMFGSYAEFIEGYVRVLTDLSRLEYIY